MKRTLITAIALALAGTVTACGDDGEPDAIPTSTSSGSPSAAEPTETETTPSWEDDYTPKQVRAFEAALQQFESYEQRSEPIWAEGKATPTAEALFKEYFPFPRWQFVYQQLETYEEVDVKTEGLATVFWSRPTSISRNARNVEIEQCVDYTSIKNTQRGNAIEPERWATQPRLRRITLSRPAGYGWLIYELNDAASEPRPERCEP